MLQATRQQGKVGMPPHTGPWLDWNINVARKAAPHNGATDSFQYIFPTPKYVEAYTSMGGPGWGAYWTYLNYNHGNQPYDWRDAGFNAWRAPVAEAHIQLPLMKISPKSSAPGLQLAQQQMSWLIAQRQSPGIPLGF